MRKIGILPFHYWVYIVMDGLSGFLVLWFLTFQKLPLMGVFMMLMVYEVVLMLVLGFFMCFFHLYVVKDYKLMLILVSCESFNWIMICYIFSVVSGLLLFLYYFFFRVLIIPVFSRFFEVDFEWLVVIVYINVPLGVSFFVKVLTLSVVMPSLGFWVVLVFFLIFMNFISLMV